jgi:phage replication-related protein YjqB (UPF0714/DUF867 family)
MKQAWSTLIFAVALNASADTYRDYADLAAHEREGADYRVTVRDEGAGRTVLAIHGGWIERGTSELARAVAGGASWNLYLFEADRMALHLTSTHFDEPRAVALAGRSERVLSLHGFYQGEDKSSIVCVGGGDLPGALALARGLETKAAELAIQVEFPCTRFGGSDPLNIVNRGRSGGGVQLELSRPLRERLRGDAEFLRRLAEVLGGA